jgi:putative holliday junction resolvase
MVDGQFSPECDGHGPVELSTIDHGPSTLLTTIPPHGRVLSLDWGTNRIGIAVSDETQLVATPLDTLRRRSGRRFPMKTFLDIVARVQPVGLVVGLPIDDNGREGVSAQAARAMGEDVAARTALPLDWTDESFSTADAAEHLRESGGKVTLDNIDAHAAATLLQEWLDGRSRQ